MARPDLIKIALAALIDESVNVQVICPSDYVFCEIKIGLATVNSNSLFIGAYKAGDLLLHEGGPSRPPTEKRATRTPGNFNGKCAFDRLTAYKAAAVKQKKALTSA